MGMGRLTDGQSRRFGVPSGNFTEFIFEDGEHLTSLSLWASGDGTCLGAIKFKTNQSQEFFVLKPLVPVDVASGICMGIKGHSGLNIDCIGFMFINTIKSNKLTNVEYSTLWDVICKGNQIHDLPQ